jgi:hypothetical protein
MKKFTLLLILLVAGFVLPRSFTTAIFAETKTESLTVTGVVTEVGGGEKVDIDLAPNTGTVVWHAYSDKAYATGTSNAQLGSTKNTFKDGTITLTKTAIPDNSTITAVKITGYSGSSGSATFSVKVGSSTFSATTSKWTTSSTTLTFTGSQTISGEVANQIVITATAATKALYISKLEVEYEEPAPSAVSTPVITGPDGTFFGEAEVSISGEEDASIYYTLDGTEPTASSTHYTEAFKIKETTTVKAIAIKGEDTSYVATKEFTAGKTFATIAALIEAAPASTETVCVTGPVVVSAYNSTYLFVQDEDGAHGLNLGKISSATYKAGQRFENVKGTYNASASGTSSNFTAETSSLVAEDGDAPTPAEKTISELTASSDYNIYIKVTNAKVTSSNSKYFIGDNNDIQLYGYTATLSASNGVSYDIEGIYVTYNNKPEILLTSIEQHVSAEKPATPVVTYNGEAVDANAEVAVWPNESIKVSIDGATSYKVNGGEATTGASFTITTDDKAEAVSYSIVGVNDNGESDAFAFSYKVKEPEIEVSYNGEVIDGEKYAILSGRSVKFAANGATSSEYTFDGTTVEGTSTVKIEKFGAYTFKAKNAAGEVSKTITFEEGNAEVYQLTTSTADLVAGDLYIVAAASADYGYAMSTSSADKGVSITKTGNYIINPSNDVQIFTLEGSEGAWKLMTSDASGLYVGNSSTSVGTSTSPNTFKITYTSGVVSVQSTTSTDRSIKFNNTDSFKNYASSYSSCSAIALYHLVKGEQAFTKTTDDNESYLFGGKAVVLYAEEDEVWLELGSTHFYGVILDDDLGNAEDLFEINKEVSYFEITEASNVDNAPTTYYQGYITSAPLVVSEESEDKTFEIIADGTELTNDYVGKIARVHGKVESNDTEDIDNPRMTLTSDKVTYTIVKRFNKRAEESSSNVRSRAGDEDEADDNTTTNTGVVIWNSASDEWNTFTEGTDLYVGGVVGLDKDLGVVLYPTVISTNENNVTSKIDMPVDSEIMVIGNSIVSEGASVYNLSGARVQPRNLAKGVYIVRLVNGTARKIAIK